MRRASRLARDAIARASRAHAPASATSTSAPALASALAPSSLGVVDRRAPSSVGADVALRRALSTSARMMRKRGGDLSRAPVRAEDLRYDRVVAVEDASRALAPVDGTLYGTPPKTWVEREGASWDDEQAKIVDELFESYDSESKYVRGSGMPTLEEVLAGARAAPRQDEEEDGEEEEAVDPNAPLVRVPIRDAAGRSYGTGKRKTAVARVWLAPGSGEHKVNGKPYDEYFPSPSSRAEMVAPFFVSGTLGLFTVVADVRGGGISGQAQAIRHGVSVALQNYDPAFRPALKAAGYLRRDPRVVERKKPGKAKARKSFAWVKR